MHYIKLCFLIFFCCQTSCAWGYFPYAIDQLIQELPEFKQFPDDYQVEKIDTGLTNQNFKIIFPTRTYFARLGSDNADLLGLNTDREVFCTKAAASMGIAPGIILYLSNEHAMVLPYIDSKPLEKNRASYGRMLTVLRQFHQSKIILPTTLCPYEVIKDYYRYARDLRPDHHIPLASHVLPIVEEIRTVIPRFRQITPCHLDLFFRNFLDDGEKIWIIDWEYSAMADPLFDLATLVSSDKLSFAEMKEILELYLNTPSEKDLAYLYLLSILADVRWWLWNHIQSESSQIESNYLDFADDSLFQIMQKTNHPQYQKSLQLLK